MIWFILILTMGASMFAQWRLRSKFEKYSRTRLLNNMSGEEAARKMLADNNIFDVKVMSVEGQLTDHYNPTDKTVNLSRDVFYGRNAAAVAVASHEVGHAVQHATAYAALAFRSSMVPVLSVTSRFMPWVIFGGVLMLQATPLPLMIGIGLFGFTTLFSFVTLPVEFDASNRALAWLDTRNVVTREELDMSRDALWWAASTYVIAALSSLATLIYYISILNGRRND